MIPIQLKHINKSFGEHIVFEDVTTTFPAGHISGLIGPNGIGKTTLIRILFNLDQKYTGEVYFGEMSNQDVNIYQYVYYMQDSQILYPYLTGYDHLKFLTDVHHLAVDRIDQIAEEVGIKNYLNKRVGSYSLGMKQHLLIAMAMINDPDCIVMDEPFNGLDPTSVHEFKQILKQLRQKGKTLLLSSHNLAIIQELVDDVFLIKDKKLHQVELDRAEKQQAILEFETREQEDSFMRLCLAKGLKAQVTNQGVRLESDLLAYINLLIQAQLQLKAIHYQQMTLEELYQHYYIEESNSAH